MVVEDKIKKFKPWLYFDEEDFSFKIKDDAPEEIKKEYKRFLSEKW